MNETITNNLYESQPAVNNLNKVSGFEPQKFLRKTVSKQKEEILYLDLKFKKLWFKLAYPKGYIKKTALKVNEQIAIIEAKIFFDRNDNEPAASFIAQRNADSKPGALHIEDAQYAAENRALIDAGFGIQFCDVSEGPDREILDAGIPVSKTEENIEPVSIAVKEESVVAEIAKTTPTELPHENKERETLNEIAATVQQKDIPATETAEKMQEIESIEEIDDVSDSQSSQPENQTAEIISTQTIYEEPPVESDAPVTAAIVEKTADVLTTAAIIPAADIQPQNIVSETSVNADARTNAEKSSAQAAYEIINEEKPQENIPQNTQVTTYTADMPVEKILETMTLAEAGAVVVDTGTCKDWMMADVLEKRPASLKWYINGYPGSNNIMKAAATLMLKYKEEKAA